MASAGVLVFAGKTVAAAVIKEIVNKAFSYLNSYFGAETMAELKRKLDGGMPKIQLVLDIVSPDQVKGKSAALDTWFWQLRDAFEKAEDAIDEIEYFELKQKAKDRKVSDWGSSLAKIKNKAAKRVKDIKIVEKTVTGFTHRKTLRRLRKALEDLDKAAAGVADFLTLADRLKGHAGLQEDGFLNSDRETGSMLTTTEVFGRHKEKELLVGWLTNTTDEDSEIVVSSNHVSVFSIVGHGGMGKTTLARLIYNDGVVTNHFQEVIWVCVSTSFDVKAIISKILESVTRATPDATSLEALQKILREKLSSVKFLLILDDVWEDKKGDQWKNLFAPLREGKSGSKILLTTRMRSVADLAADAMEAPNRCLPLRGLKEDENIKLFNRHAFPREKMQNYTALQKIGEQIATSVKGCPLVIKVVASHLRDHLTFQYWNIFLHQSLENFKGNEEDIMKVLKLSYYHLPTEMQTCFRYCSMFPQDYRFRKDKLVEMWISSGLISQATVGPQSNLLDIGEQYLFQLTRKSFFDRISVNYQHIDSFGSQEYEYYVMHDLMHDLAKCVSVGECARIVDVSSLENAPRTIRHICIEYNNNLPVEKIKEITLMENLRTIILKDKQNKMRKDILDTVEELVESSKSLRLFLSNLRHTSNFPDKLAKLYHLRFVSLQNTSAQSICGIVKLYYLTTLDCGAVKYIEPKTLRQIGNLDRLRYINYQLGGRCIFPVSRLNYLRVLDDYYLSREQGYSISALKNLRNLRRLGVRCLEDVDTQEEAKKAELKGNQYLESLCLVWSLFHQSLTDELILDNLEPHANLKELRISRFSGTRMPQWITKPSVENLTRLQLLECQNCEQLPVLEILTLKHLELSDLPRLITIGRASDVSEDERVEVFLPPNLQRLLVKRCPKLGKLPILPSSLVALEVDEVGLTKLPRIEKRYHGNADTTMSHKLQKIIVKGCHSLVSLEGSLFEQKEYMGVLHELSIDDCIQLEYTPLSSFEDMNGLKLIIIRECPQLRTLRGAEEKLLPSSSRHLTIGQCGDLELPLLKSLQRLRNLTTLDLQGCIGLVSFPSADVCSKNLKLLRNLRIIGCDNLISLGGLGFLPSLYMLEITQCCKLVEAARSSLTGYASVGGEEHLMLSHPKHLGIDLASLLRVQPLNSLRLTQRLVIEDASEGLPEQWLLQNCASLQSLQLYKAESLPLSMTYLSALEKLTLFAEKYESLPDLPLSLHDLYFRPHPDLQKKFRCRGSPERYKISHVQSVQIEGSLGQNLYFILGKECNLETFYQLRYHDFDTLSSWANQQKDVYKVAKKMLPWLSRS